jgi:hypothetical protein
VARDRELEALGRELERMRTEGDRGMRTLEAIAGELDQVRRQARSQATRMRMRALREAADLSERIAELGIRPERERERLLESIAEAIARIGVEDELELTEADVGAGGRVTRSAEDMFDGMVEIEVGPLDDFAQLVGFEDAAGAITATSEISVRRFARGRATLEMRLSEPTELLHELEQRAPFEFRVRKRRFDRLVLDVGADSAAAA